MANVQDPVTARAAARVGRVLKEKWRLDRLLGVGGMAAVYEAVHRNGKRVAVKMLHAEHSSNADVRDRFLREGYVANAVEHDGAVSVLDDDVDADGSAFLVMELLGGETLEARWLRAGRKLPAVEVLHIADKLLDVLGAAHDKGIVHRDIKPENVFLARSGAVKVLDFGIARVRELSTRSNATQAGATMGTPAFMPPEQARGRWNEVDARTDVWAVGATMFTLLTGRYVHEAETVNELLLAAMTTPAPPVATIMPVLAGLVGDLVDRALAFDRAARFPDARAMQLAIRAASTKEPRATPPPQPASLAQTASAAPTSNPASPARAGTLTTGRPVIQPPMASVGRTNLGPPPIALVAIAGVVIVTFVVSVGGAVAWRRSRPPASSAAAHYETAAATAAPAASTQVVAPAPSAPPGVAAVDVDDLPTATVQRTGATVVVSPASASRPIAPTATASGARAKPSCNPPFEFDAKGVKRWKVGCL